MARAALRLANNAAGELFVDSSCIDCETCRAVAPATFVRDDAAGQSIVGRQPGSDAEWHRALMALVACPTASIGTEEKRDVGAAAAAFPEELAPGIFYCGYAAESSFGASSYLIRRPGGNVLVDSPRGARQLLKRIAALGGAAYLFLTHRDDVADHALLRKTFELKRILHAGDVSAGTREVELQPAGDAPIALADDLKLIPTPGHTRGSACLLHRAFLFTGDHLWGDEDTGRLGASRGVCWYSWDEQVKSLERLLEFDFTHVLPGHGRRFVAGSPEAMRDELRALLRRLRK